MKDAKGRAARSVVAVPIDEAQADQLATADWNDELDQFYGFVENWKEINGYPDAPDLIVPPESIKGGRSRRISVASIHNVAAERAGAELVEASRERSGESVTPAHAEGVGDVLSS